MEPEALSKTLTSIASWTFVIAIIFFIAASVILNYHWSKFEIDKSRIRKIQGVYFGISGILIIIMIGLLVNLLK
jgi:hypothetical protein